MNDLILYVAVILVIAMVVKILTSKPIKNIIKEEKEYSPYYLKQKMMNSSEQAFFISLNKYLGSNYIISHKIRVEDFVEVKRNGISKEKRFGYRNRIKSRHVDFLISDLNTTKPVIAIEIDGGSHKNYNRIERDKKMDKIYSDIGFKIIHIKVGSNFDHEAQEIKNLLIS